MSTDPSSPQAGRESPDIDLWSNIFADETNANNANPPELSPTPILPLDHQPQHPPFIWRDIMTEPTIWVRDGELLPSSRKALDDIRRRGKHSRPGAGWNPLWLPNVVTPKRRKINPLAPRKENSSPSPPPPFKFTTQSHNTTAAAHRQQLIEKRTATANTPCQCAIPELGYCMHPVIGCIASPPPSTSGMNNVMNDLVHEPELLRSLRPCTSFLERQFMVRRHLEKRYIRAVLNVSQTV